MFSNLFKKSDKPSAAVFVDYEHWYYGYNNIFSMKPNVQEWYDELTEEYNVKKLMFFGDFNAKNKSGTALLLRCNFEVIIHFKEKTQNGNIL